MNLLLDLAAHPVIGHRGAAGPAPENTLGALRFALEQGADALEFDVRLSRCETPVLMHDPTIDRTTAAVGPVQARTMAQLAQLGVPSLVQVLEEFPKTPLLIELKTLEAAEPTRRVLLDQEAVERVVIASFLDGALARFRGGPFRTSASRRGIFSLWARTRLGLGASGGGGPDQVYAVPDRYRGKVPVPSPRFVRAARRAGRPVHVWTVNDPDRAVQLWHYGVSGIVTDYPARIVAARRGAYPSP